MESLDLGKAVLGFTHPGLFQVIKGAWALSVPSEVQAFYGEVVEGRSDTAKRSVTGQESS